VFDDDASGVTPSASIARMRIRARSGSHGQSLAEYALIVALIVIVALVALTFFGTQINDILSAIADTING
jgi:Flp pilus assembly pilin Flp